MRDPDNLKEDWKNLKKPVIEAHLLPEEDSFRWYIQNSKPERDKAGIRKEGDLFVISDLETVRKLPEWKKIILRELVKRK